MCLKYSRIEISNSQLLVEMCSVCMNAGQGRKNKGEPPEVISDSLPAF